MVLLHARGVFVPNYEQRQHAHSLSLSLSLCMSFHAVKLRHVCVHALHEHFSCLLFSGLGACACIGVGMWVGVWGGGIIVFEPLTEVADRSCQTASMPVQNESQNKSFDEVLYACTSCE